MQNSRVLDNPQANPVEIGWLVGMIEGEGSFVMNRANYQRQIQARMMWSNTDAEIVQRFISILDKLKVRRHVCNNRRNSRLGKKPRTDVQVYRYIDVVRLMDVVLPWMTPGIKKERALCVDRFVRSRLAQLNASDPKRNLLRGWNNQQRAYTPEQQSILEHFQSLRESPREQRSCPDESRAG